MAPSARGGLTGPCRSASGMGGRRATGDFCSRSEGAVEAEGGEAAEGSERLSAFSDFVDSLDFEDLDKGKKDDDDE